MTNEQTDWRRTTVEAMAASYEASPDTAAARAAGNAALATVLGEPAESLAAEPDESGPASPRLFLRSLHQALARLEHAAASDATPGYRPQDDAAMLRDCLIALDD